MIYSSVFYLIDIDPPIHTYRYGTMYHPKYGKMGQFLNVYEICDLFLLTNKTKISIQNSNFDLVIMDATFNVCGYALAYKYKTKTILFSSLPLPSMFSSISLWMNPVEMVSFILVLVQQ